jgi:hypothetical protein
MICAGHAIVVDCFRMTNRKLFRARSRLRVGAFEKCVIGWVRGSERTGKECRFALSVNPVLQRPPGFRGIIQAAARRFGGFFELSHRFSFVFLPV